LKPGPSASRTLLDEAVKSIKSVYPPVDLFDLREANLPFFDGQDPTNHLDASVQLAGEAVRACGGLVISVPCYWNSVSGVFKNFIDVLCGAAYDLAEPVTVFTGKPVGLIVVGADHDSATSGHVDAERIIRGVGGTLVADSVIVANPRQAGIAASVPAQITRLGLRLTKEVLERGRNA
jgi:NAD(P)H-dependent FMN reductase